MLLLWIKGMLLFYDYKMFTQTDKHTSSLPHYKVCFPYGEKYKLKVKMYPDIVCFVYYCNVKETVN